MISVAATTLVVTIMALGDDMTRGDGPQVVGGYRDDLQTLLTNANIPFDFVGDQCDGVGFDCDWQGGTLLRANDLVGTVEATMTQYHPDIVILNIGTWDFFFGESPTTVADGVAQVVENIHTASPQTKIIALGTFGSIFLNSTYSVLNDEIIEAMDVFPFVTFIDAYHTLQRPNDFIAMLLPNDTGYGKIALAVFGPVVALSASLLSPPAPIPIPSAFVLMVPALAFALPRRRAKV